MDVGQYVIPFNRLRHGDVQRVGGKNASLGEMLSQLSASELERAEEHEHEERQHQRALHRGLPRLIPLVLTTVTHGRHIELSRL